MSLIKKLSSIIILSSFFLIFLNCSSDSHSSGGTTTPEIIITGNIDTFETTDVLTNSSAKSIKVKGSGLTSDLTITTSNNFKISSDNSTFSNKISFRFSDINDKESTIYIVFSPAETAIGNISGTLSFVSSKAKSVSINLSGTGVNNFPSLILDDTTISFDDLTIDQESSSIATMVKAQNLTETLELTAPSGFQISLDNITFSNSLSIQPDIANGETTVYVKFMPTAVKRYSGALVLENSQLESFEIILSGQGVPDYANAIIHNYKTFDKERLAYGSGFEQFSIKNFTLHDDLSNISQIKMYVQLTCPNGGCDEWDVYANVLVKDPDTTEWFELGRYITPYWNDNSQLPRGFVFDVTDFKSMLKGSSELRIFTECWNAKGYEVSIDFDYIEGTPDYEYYSIAKVIEFNNNSIEGVPYGKPHSLDLDKSITVPNNSQSTHLRTIISGWGHATPNDVGGRGCAEWCFRTHDIKIDGANKFQHYLGPIGCEANPVSNQNPGNWKPNRAGWCPGMEVPTRLDYFNGTKAGTSFTFQYDFKDWSNNNGNGDAFYAISTYIVVKSHSEIAKAIVSN